MGYRNYGPNVPHPLLSRSNILESETIESENGLVLQEEKYGYMIYFVGMVIVLRRIVCEEF